MKKSHLVLFLLPLALLPAVTGCFMPRIQMNITVNPNATAMLATAVNLENVQEGVREFYQKHHRLPATLADVKKLYDAWKPGRKRAKWDEVIKDGWGSPILYEQTGATTYRLTSFGCDRAPGGEDEAKDIHANIDVTESKPGSK